ncbi:MAG: hypothetical protein HY262_09075 [Chloroflexi bacterium]|nr:hypothetical protein [Chloroflexota bacterium]
MVRSLLFAHKKPEAYEALAAAQKAAPEKAEVLLAADRACFVAKRSGRDRIATAAEGLALAAEFSLQEPTPVDPVEPGVL